MFISVQVLCCGWLIHFTATSSSRIYLSVSSVCSPMCGGWVLKNDSPVNWTWWQQEWECCQSQVWGKSGGCCEPVVGKLCQREHLTKEKSAIHWTHLVVIQDVEFGVWGCKLLAKSTTVQAWRPEFRSLAPHKCVPIAPKLRRVGIVETDCWGL